MTFDWTINLPIVITAAAWIVGVFRVWLQQRDFNRDILVLIGKRAPKDERHGLLGDVAELKECRDIHQALLDSHQVAVNVERRHERHP